MLLSKIVPVDNSASDQVKEFLKFLPSVLANIIMEYYLPGCWYLTGIYKTNDSSYHILDNNIINILYVAEEKNKLFINNFEENKKKSINLGNNITYSSIIIDSPYTYIFFGSLYIICVNYYTEEIDTLCIDANYIVYFQCIKDNIFYTSTHNNSVEKIRIVSKKYPEKRYLIKNITLFFDTINNKFYTKSYYNILQYVYNFLYNSLSFCYCDILVSENGMIATCVYGKYSYYIILLDSTKNIMYAIKHEDNPLFLLHHDNEKIIYSEWCGKYDKIFIHYKQNLYCKEQIIDPLNPDYLLSHYSVGRMNENVLLLFDNYDDTFSIYRS